MFFVIKEDKNIIMFTLNFSLFLKGGRVSAFCSIIHFIAFHFIGGRGGVKGKSTIFTLFSVFFFGKLP